MVDHEHQKRTPAVDIEFSDLSYTVRGKKTILHSLSGQFRAGELTAILGSSGAGKSSLMDILIGYKSMGVTGSIYTNKRARNPQTFHNLSCYIHQEQLVQPHLSVLEAMNVAASLKLGPNTSHQHRDLMVSDILSTLGLSSCRDTTAERLSGGQRKRLSIALELLSNPPVLFLDEPTTGLDVVAVSQCMQLLRSLALQQGRTIVCTVHQPSASLFALFHHVYVLAEGRCVYQGSAEQLVPFLAAIDLPCPPYNNPADHVIELTQSCGDHVTAMSLAIQNGKLSLRGSVEEGACRRLHAHDPAEASAGAFPTSARRQFVVLLHRMLLQISRDKAALALQVVYHIVTSLMLSSLFLGSGQDAAKSYQNFMYCMGVVLFFHYTHVITPVLLFPAQVKLLKREYFNRWYGLKPYFFAMSVARLPLMLSLGAVFVVVTYVLTDQPLEAARFLPFLLVSLLVGVVSESLGLTVGASCSVLIGSVLGPAISIPLLTLALYGVGFGPLIDPSIRLLMSLSFLRYGAEGLTLAVYGQDRAPLECQQLYCHYRRPAVLLRDLGMENVTVQSQIVALVIFLVFFRSLSFFALRYRLTPEFNNRILDFSARLFRRR